jgi:choline dehydrogenase
MPSILQASYDYIVVGGGSAGAVIAARLSEQPDTSVLLLEAGPRDRHILLRMPLAFRILRQKMLFDWGYDTEPEPHANHRRLPAARGKVLGGSSSVNGMMYSRGHPADYDRWAALGATGWSYEEVLPYFRKSENSERGASRWHGVGGPLQVATDGGAARSDPLVAALQATARHLGYGITDDLDGPVPEGFGVPDRTVGNGRRSSTSTAFLDPARHRPNLHIVTDAHVTRILTAGDAACGVELLRHGQRQTVWCEAEVVLSAGTYASPQLLMLSGIGPADRLRALGLPVVADLPGVGQGLKEHPLVPMGFRGRRPFALRGKLRADRIALEALRWQFTGRGTIASMPVASYAFHRSQPELALPDLESIILPISLQARVWFPGIRAPHEDVMTVLNCVLRPQSVGSVTLRSANPLDTPEIRFNILSEPGDLALLRHSIGWTRRLMQAAPLNDFVGEEIFPGAAVDDPAAMDAYIRASVVTAQHPTSTCRMGTGAGSVVDPQLRVHGLRQLRVADASVMPELIGGHTNAPSIMIGERAADFIRSGR